MNSRGEKLSRARILLSELSSLDVFNIEANKLQPLAIKYDALSNDHEIKDHFRRMEQSISISPVVLKILDHAKENPASISSYLSEATNSNDAIHAQEMQIQELRQAYASLSDEERKNITYEAFTRFVEAHEEVKYDHPEHYNRWVLEDPSRIYHRLPNGQMHYEEPNKRLEILQEQVHILIIQSEQTSQNITKATRLMAVIAAKNGNSEEVRQQILEQTADDPALQQAVLREFDETTAKIKDNPNHFPIENNPSLKSAQGTFNIELSNRQTQQKQARKISEGIHSTQKVIQTNRTAGETLGDEQVTKTTSQQKETASKLDKDIKGVLKHLDAKGIENFEKTNQSPQEKNTQSDDLRRTLRSASEPVPQQTKQFVQTSNSKSF